MHISLSLSLSAPIQLEARQLNHREVVEEDRRSKLPANWESRQRRVEWEEEDEKARQVCGVGEQCLYIPSFKGPVQNV